MTTPEDQDPLLNTVLGGARIQRRVSAGLLANVYLGLYERLNVPVAVKVLSPKATAQGVNKERFIREGRALAQLSHPNVIKIYNVGHEAGRYFIVMDWIQDGMNLRQLAQTRPLTPGQSLKVLRRLAEALDYIHQKSLIHRDLKPANICLRKGGHPVLMDFSLIKDQSSDVQLTAPGTIMGTVNFMPPEQAQPGGPFGNVGPWSDVYSLGGTLYWLLTGRPPFKGRTPMETIIKLIREPFVPASQINPSIPPEVDAFLTRCLAKKPEERYQSAREFMSAIDDLFARASEALQRSVPPAPASEEDAGGPPAPGAAAAAAAVAPVSASGAQPVPAGASGAQQRAWGGAAASSGSMPAMPPAGVPQAAPAASSGMQRSPMAAPVAAAPPPGVRQTSRMAPGAVPAALEASPAAGGRPSTRISGQGVLVPQGGPAAPAAPTEGWKPANGLDVPPDDAATIKIKHGQGPGAQSAGTRPSQVGRLDMPPPAVQAAAPAGGDLKRSWVEDVASAPSWTEQEKDPGASTLGMTAPAPGVADTGRNLPAQAPSAPAYSPPASPPINKATTKTKAKKGWSLELILVVGAIFIITICIGLAIFVFVYMK